MHLLENGPLPDSGSRDRNLACLAQLTCKNLLSIAALKQTYQSSPQRPNTERSWMMVQSFDSPAVLTSSVGLVITFPEALWLDLVRGPDSFSYRIRAGGDPGVAAGNTGGGLLYSRESAPPPTAPCNLVDINDASPAGGFVAELLRPELDPVYIPPQQP
ncbi:hypothetical protein STEG23_030321 [Scotinomys teguina]